MFLSAQWDLRYSCGKVRVCYFLAIAPLTLFAQAPAAVERISLPYTRELILALFLIAMNSMWNPGS